MKKLFAVLILGSITVFSGCLISSDNKKDDNSGGGGTETAGFNTYLPYKLGSSWTYYEKTYNRYTHEYTHIETIIGTKFQAGKIYWMLESRSQNSSSDTDTSLVRIEGNTVYGYYEGYPHIVVPKSVKAVRAAKAMINAGGSDFPILKFGLSPLQTWTIYDVSGLQYHRVETGKYLGIEGAQVEVPAGNFSGCAKYEFTYESYIKTDTWEYFDRYVITAWYAPNVGRVKISGDMSEPLTSYTTP